MRSTSPSRAAPAFVLAVLAIARAPAVHAQQAEARGFALERLYPSAPGGGFWVADELRLEGGLGGAVSLTLGYAHAPLRVAGQPGAGSLAVVRHETLATLAMAVTYDRFRAWASFASPIYLAGQGGDAGAFHFTTPAANLEQNPDTLFDVLLGVDARLWGDAHGPFRLGAGAQLWAPSGDRADYGTDGTARGMVRMLAAGEAGRFSYAGHVGVHLRPLDEAIPGSPRGSELLFAAAGGMTFPLGAHALIVGPELFGASPLRALFSSDATALEALLGARLELARKGSAQLRFKLGAGAALHAQSGAPEWRFIGAVELGGEAGPAGPAPGATSSPSPESPPAPRAP